MGNKRMYIMHAWQGIELYDRVFYLYTVRGWRSRTWVKRVQAFKCVVCTQPTNEFLQNTDNAKQVLACHKDCWTRAKDVHTRLKEVG